MVTAKERAESVRPTEAQLRWAQFHHQRRAVSVREQVERLYQTPANVSDVPDAQSDDGITTDESSVEGVSSPWKKQVSKRRREKPKISRGRRAYLRVSKRKYEKRRADILENGFQCRDEEVEEEEEDFIDMLLAEEAAAVAPTTSARKRHRKRRHTIRRRSQHAVIDDEERVRRFEAAYHAMLMNLAPQQQPDIVMTPSKRWTRKADAPVAVSIDGRQYDEWRLGLVKMEPVHSAGAATPSTPFDRRASWLVHLPERQSVSTIRQPFAKMAVDSNGEPLEPVHALPPEARMMILSPGQMKFDDLVATLQQREIEHQQRLKAEGQVSCERGSSAAKFRERFTRKYGSFGGDKEADESPTVERLESYAPKPTPRVADPQPPGFDSPVADSEAESGFWRSARNMHDTTPDVRNSHVLVVEQYGQTDSSPVQDDRDGRIVPTRTSGSLLGSPAAESEANTEFWNSARKMEDTTPNIVKTTSDTVLHGQSEASAKTSAQQSDRSTAHRGVLTPKNQQDAGSPSLHSEADSEVSRSARNMHDTTPNVDSEPAQARTILSKQGSGGGSKRQPRISEVDADNHSHGEESHDDDSDFWQNARHMYDTVPESLAKDDLSPLHHSPDGKNRHHDKFLSKGRSWATSTPHDSLLSPSSMSTTSKQETPLSTDSMKSTFQHADQTSELHSLGDDDISRQAPLQEFTNNSVSERLSQQAEEVYDDSPSISKIDEGPLDEDLLETPPDSSGMRLGARMSGLFNNVFSGKKAGENHEDEIRVLAAFRKMQDGRRGHKDDATSTSSYRVLPEGIRRVVQNFSVSKGKAPAEKQQQPEEDDMHLIDAAQPTSRSAVSPGRSGTTGTSASHSPDHDRALHQRIMDHSALIGEMAAADDTVIDTDGASLASGDPKMAPHVAASLFLSPTILTKRLQQAIRATERQKWDQLSYLISANPWLAEMTDVTTEQYLLHKLALYGGGVPVVDPDTNEILYTDPAPDHLNLELIRMFPSSVHKFDQDGNLPLHMAAVSGNKAMVDLLGERFPSGASVRNNEGLLPLHLAIQACPSQAADGDVASATKVIKTILRLFPGAVAVPENDGNLPIHCAASSLNGDVGVDVMYMLLDEADRQVESGTIFRTSEHKPKTPHSFDEDESISGATDITATATDSSTLADDGSYCSLVRNSAGYNPLAAAIRAKAGWQLIDAIAGGPGGKYAALQRDVGMSNNALHLLATEEFADPVALLSVLRVAPDAASARNAEGALPIELASMCLMPREVIMALVLADLPIDLQEKEGVKVRENFGGSWWFLTCECDDHHFEIVLEVMSLCSYPQLRELCFMKGTPAQGNGTVITRATPRCRDELRKALRFVGRFEFVGGTALQSSVPGLKIFDALDFGSKEEPYEEGRRVELRCYALEDTFMDETVMLRDFDLDTHFIEEAFDFAVQELDDESGDAAPQQYCVAVERPTLTLDQVVAGMLKNDDYRTKPDMRNRYLSKVSMVLRIIAKALRYLHDEGVVHGNVCLEAVGKFEDTWKLTEMLEMQPAGDNFDASRFGKSSPPEALAMLRDVVEDAPTSRQVTFVGNLTSDPSIDIWAFGKLAYEVLTGMRLIPFDSDKSTRQDQKSLLQLYKWCDADLNQVVDNLRKAGVPTLGADLVSHCLLPDPQDRPANMEEVLNHPFWRDMRRRSTQSRGQQQRAEQIRPDESEI